MKGFLDKLAETLLEEDALYRKTVIFPNRRPALFLEKKLSELSGKPVIAPRIFSITDFLAYITGKRVAEQYELLLMLFETYGEVTRKAGLPAQSFDRFIGWGHVLLNDFDEIDKFLVSPDDILDTLMQIKEIDRWDLQAGESAEMNDYLQFFERLPEIYKNFRRKLESQNSAYDGMLYREAWEQYSGWENRWARESIILAGFNALTRAEEQIFRRLISDRKAKIFWDADRFYLNDPFEAGKFLRKYQKDQVFGKDFKWIFDTYHPPKTFYTVHATDSASQIQFAVKQLKAFEINTRENKDAFRLNTLIVLNDPSMLTELLHTLPEDLDKVNLSFSLPAYQMQTVRLTELYIRFYAEAERSGNVNLKDFLYLIKHPFFKIPGFDTLQSIEEEILQQRNRFIDREDFHALMRDKGLERFFPEIKHPAQLLEQLDRILDITGENIERNHPERIAWMEIAKLVKRLHDMQNRFGVFNNLLATLKFYKRMVKEMFLRFSGHPLKGYQIMGLLETRLLDFDRILMLGMNEGIIPKGKALNSFIPYDVRRHFGLPVYDDKNAVTAYHFYRLLAKARQVWLLYDASAKGITSGEPSRYILQLKEMLPQRRIEIKDIYLSGDARTLPLPQHIKKDGEFADRLKKYLEEKGVSASMLISYKHYPADFYRRYVLGWEEKPLLEDFVAANRMGNVIHNTMEKLYTPYVNRILTPEIIRKLIRLSDETTERFFFDEFQQPDRGTKKKLKGKNILALAGAKEMVKKFLRIDLQAVRSGNEIIVLDTEKKLAPELNISGIGKVKCKGFIDRTDVFNGQLRIVDYKTGRADASYKKIQPGSDFFEKVILQKKYWFQLYFYLWLLWKTGEIKGKDNPAPVIYTVRSTKPLLHPPWADTEAFLQAFESYLFDLLREMLDIQRHFSLEPPKV